MPTVQCALPLPTLLGARAEVGLGPVVEVSDRRVGLDPNELEVSVIFFIFYFFYLCFNIVSGKCLKRLAVSTAVYVLNVEQ